MAVQTISPQEFVSLCKQGQTLTLIDVRTPGEYAGVHAEGARLYPLDRLDPKLVLADRNGQAGSVYVICKSGMRANKACEVFQAAGFTDVVCVSGGTDAWVQAGLPVVRGQGVISLDRQMRIVAGGLVVAGVVLGLIFHRGFLGLSVLVGCGLMFAGLTDICPMLMMLARMPWNQRCGTQGASCCNK